jgi:hypothetical protein
MRHKISSLWGLAIVPLCAVTVVACGGDSFTAGGNGSPKTCATLACGPHGDCVEGKQGPSCVCDEGYIGTLCDACESGYVDPEGDGTCALECDLDCGAHGVCVSNSGVEGCSCSAGYAGASCDECASGFEDPDDDGVCEPVGACSLDCGVHGTCVGSSGGEVCECEEGYEGDGCDECAPGFEDPDENGSCEPLILCDSDCGLHGVCVVESGQDVCRCDEGYAGQTCETCAPGYQDNDGDGTCKVACAQDGTDCSGHGTCDDASGTPVCSCAAGYAGDACEGCASGYQDHDDDGTCAPDCSGVACPAKSACEDASGTAICVCLTGYEMFEGACRWGSVPADQGFQQPNVWTASGAATIDAAHNGFEDVGVGLLGASAICGTGSLISQTFPMPSYADAEPLVLQVSSRVVDPDDVCNSINLGTRINGGWHWHALSKTFQTFTTCLGERGYGGPVELGFRSTPCSTCDPGQQFSVLVDNVRIVPDAAGKCPAPGKLLNGDFEQNAKGWTFRTQGTNATAAVAAGVGISGSAAGRLATQVACSDASMATLASVPLASNLPRAAIEIWSKGATGKVYPLRIGETPSGAPLGVIQGTGAAKVDRFCLLPSHAGLVQALQVEIPYVSGTCAAANVNELLVDGVKVVSEPSCPSTAIIDPGFENGAAAPNLGRSWELLTSGTGTAAIVQSISHSGAASLRLGATQYCVNGASAAALVVVPETQRPAVRFWYRFSPGTVATASVNQPVYQQLPTVSVWTQHKVCLDPRQGGTAQPLTFAVSPPSGGCATTFAEHVLWVDDIEIVDDPSCP